MPDVSYTYQFGYTISEASGRSFPGLVIQIRTPDDEANTLDVQAHLDTGAEYSLFDGGIAAALGIDLLDGGTATFRPTAGPAIDARWHHVVIAHELLGNFPLRIAFSTGEIQRNILGRDFFSAIQIGFRERQLEFYVTPAP